MVKVNRKLFKYFPVLYKNIEDNTVIKYNRLGQEKLTPEDKKIILALEEKNKKHNLKVICVLSNKLIFGEDSPVDIDDYIFVSKECKPEVADSNLLVYAESYNRTWKINEMGSFEITEENGIVKRVY